MWLAGTVSTTGTLKHVQQEARMLLSADCSSCSAEALSCTAEQVLIVQAAQPGRHTHPAAAGHPAAHWLGCRARQHRRPHLQRHARALLFSCWLSGLLTDLRTAGEPAESAAETVEGTAQMHKSVAFEGLAVQLFKPADEPAEVRAMQTLACCELPSAACFGCPGPAVTTTVCRAGHVCVCVRLCRHAPLGLQSTQLRTF